MRHIIGESRLVTHFATATPGARDAFAEPVASLLVTHLVADAREGWAFWARLGAVNKSCAEAFRRHAGMITSYRIAHMTVLLLEQQRELFLFRRQCTCGCFWRSDDSEGGSEADIHDHVMATPEASQEY